MSIPGPARLQLSSAPTLNWLQARACATLVAGFHVMYLISYNLFIVVRINNNKNKKRKNILMAQTTRRLGPFFVVNAFPNLARRGENLNTL
jgi:hypothetical protein